MIQHGFNRGVKIGADFINTHTHRTGNIINFIQSHLITAQSYYSQESKLMTKSVFSYFLEGLASQTSTPWIYFVLNFIIFLSTAAFFLFVKHILQLLILFNSRKILLISQSQLRIERLSLYTILLLFSALTSINTSDPVSAAAHIYSHAITLFQPYF